MTDQVFFSNLPNLALELNNLAVDLHEQSDFKRATHLYQNALLILKESVCMEEADCSSCVRRCVEEKWKYFLAESRQMNRGAVDTSNALEATSGCIIPPPPIRIIPGNGNDDETLSVVVLFNLGLAQFQQAHLNTAEGLFQMALSLRSSSDNCLLDISLHHTMAILYQLEGLEEEAMLELIKALQTESRTNSAIVGQRAQVMSRLGHMLISQGYLQDALDIFHAALLLQANDEEANTMMNSEPDEIAPAA